MGISLDRLNVFYQVVKHGTYGKASEVLKIKAPAISHQITSLESNFGVALLIRGRKKLTVTPQGKILYDVLKQGLPNLEIIDDLIRTNANEPTGKLHIMTWFGISIFLLTRYIDQFVERYPEINLTVQGNINEEDFDFHRSDVMINSYKENEPDLIQQYLFTTQFKAYASPSYINKYGRPKTFEDLDKHRLIAVAQKVSHGVLDLSEWHLTQGRAEVDPRKPFMIINSSNGCASMAIKGVGIACLPTYHVETIKEKLIDVFPDHEPPSSDFYYIYPRHLQNVKRVTLFGEFLQEKLGSQKALKKKAS